MMRSLQRLLARVAAIAAIVLGASLALMLALFTLIAGLAVGLIATVAAWFGARSLKGPTGPGRQPPGRESGGRQVTVIDVEMRELDAEPASDTQTPPVDREAPTETRRP